jgi:serine/threonine protein kinase/tetratricopeptide (TPR) repeat protein
MPRKPRIGERRKGPRPGGGARSTVTTPLDHPRLRRPRRNGELKRLKVGTRLGPYSIVSVLGHGGMGEVYRAHDARLGRDVAVKVLPSHLAGDAQALQRFLREARAVAALTHPNIVAIFDVGTEDEIPFIVTELLEGQTLASRIRQGPVSWSDAVDIAIAVAEALAAAHGKGLIHRDLKPENIFLTADDRVKLLDFGIARWRHRAIGSDGQKSTATLEGTIIGTLAYMSPEQARGELADAPSDIYSLGCVLFECVTGNRFFDRATPADTLATILKDVPPPPSASDPLVPADFDRVVARCLQKQPHDRFQNTTQLIAALKQLRGTGGTGTAAAAAADPVSLDAIGSIAVLPFAQTGDMADLEYLSDGITESVINSLSQLNGVRVVARTTAFQYRGQEADLESVGQKLNVRAVLIGRVARRGESLNVQCELIDVPKRSQIWGDQYTRKPADVFVVQEEIARDIVKRLRLKLSHEQKRRLTRRYTENTEAYELYLRGRFYWNKRTPQWMQKGIEHFKLALERDANYALAYGGLADCFAVLGSYGVLPPKEAFPRAKMAALKALEIDKSLAEAMTPLAFVEAFHDWNWVNAERDFKRAIKLRPSYATAHQWYSFMLSALGRHDDALASVRRALDLDPLSLPINSQLTWALYVSRSYDAAIQQAKRALEMDQTFGLTHYWLGVSYLQTGRYDQAIESFQTTYKVAAANLQALSALGYTHAVCGRRSEAEAVLGQLQDAAAQRYVSPFNYALVHLGLADHDRAIDWLERCVDERAFWLAWVRTDPIFDPIRDHPRFVKLFAVVGLA